jgi:hypothetical protein
MLDGRVQAVLRRLEQETADEAGKDLPVSQRSLQVPATSGALLYAIAAGRPGARCSRSAARAATRRSGSALP